MGDACSTVLIYTHDLPDFVCDVTEKTSFNHCYSALRGGQDILRVDANAGALDVPMCALRRAGFPHAGATTGA